MDRRRALLFTLAALTLVVVVALVSCGGDDAHRVRGRHLELRLDEYRITPQDVTAKAGRLRITAVDDGVLTHNLRIESKDVDDQGDPIVLASTETAHPGETVTAVAKVPPGTYRLVCSIANHEDLGQYGTLRVTR